MSPLVDRMLEESLLSFSQILSHKLLRTSELSAQERKELENLESHSTTRDPSSTESSTISWPKEEISQLETELEESPSTEWSSQTRTSNASISAEEISLWLTLVQTPMVPNSSSPSSHATGWMASTASSERSLMVWRSLMPSSLSDQAAVLLPKHALLLIAVNSEWYE